MTSFGALLRYLQKKNLGKDLIIQGNTYSADQLLLAEQVLTDVAKEFDKVRKKPRLSRRRAFIVVLEELYYDVPEYPKDIKLENIHKRAHARFEFVYRGLKSPQTIEEIHPKNPCVFFEGNGNRKARYRSALSHLVDCSGRYFQIKEAELSLIETYKEVMLC
ncbi:MAG: hypothetical protein AAF969_13375 [Bacteroidota bacterium]